MLRPRASGPASGLYYRGGAYAALDFASRIYELDDVSYTSGGLTTVPGFTFTGASLRTMFDSTGAMTYGPNNLLLQSQTFGTTWVIQSASVSSNVVAAPDGTLTADKLTEDNTTNNHKARQVVTTAVGTRYVGSVSAKAGERSILALRLDGLSNSFAWFDLSAGTVLSVQAAATAAITSAGNGWYRCSVSATGTATNHGLETYTAIANGSTSYLGDGTSGIYLWGAQLEAVTYQTTPAAYMPTTSAAYYGPRLVYDPVTLASLGILVEEARTNLCLQSQTFDDASWTKSASSITANTVASPDGTTNADKLVEDTANSVHGVEQSFSLSAVAYTYSVYIKAAGRSWAQLVNGTLANGYAYFNVSTGATGTLGAGFTSSSITDVGGGWYRCSVVFTGFAGGNITEIRAASANGTASYTGDGTSGLYLWQAQLEAGVGASSPIVTTSAAVTRAADVPLEAGLTVPPTFTVVASGRPAFDTGGNPRIFSVNDGSGNNVAEMYGAGVEMYSRVVVGGASQGDLLAGSGYAAQTAIATGLRAEVNNRRAAVNGTLGALDASDLALPASTTLNIGVRQSTVNSWNGTISRIRIYNRALNDAQLQALTA